MVLSDGLSIDVDGAVREDWLAPGLVFYVLFYVYDVMHRARCEVRFEGQHSPIDRIECRIVADHPFTQLLSCATPGRHAWLMFIQYVAGDTEQFQWLQM